MKEVMAYESETGGLHREKSICLQDDIGEFREKLIEAVNQNFYHDLENYLSEVEKSLKLFKNSVLVLKKAKPQIFT